MFKVGRGAYLGVMSYLPEARGNLFLVDRDRGRLQSNATTRLGNASHSIRTKAAAVMAFDGYRATDLGCKKSLESQVVRSEEISFQYAGNTLKRKNGCPRCRPFISSFA